MNTSTKTILLTLCAFALYFLLDEFFFYDLRRSYLGIVRQLSVSHTLAYLTLGIPIFIGVHFIHRDISFLHKLGLDKSALKGIGYSLLFTLPMFIGYAVVFSFNSGFSFDTFYIRTIAAGLFEELYFRAFLFGMLFRFSRIGFIPAVLIGALLFGAVHLYQSQDFGISIGIFLTTFMGAVLFAWLYSEWDYNLWMPVFLHLFMNLAWLLFDVSDNAFGNLWGNVFRYSTVAFAIIFTITQKRRAGRNFEVNKDTIWMKKGDPV